MDENDDKRLAIITGTSSGIGLALAKSLLSDHWTVVGMSRRQPADAIVADNPAYQHVKADLSNLSGLKNVIAPTKLLPILSSDNNWSRIALVNNAAIASSKKGVEQLADDDYGPENMVRMMTVNVAAPVYLMGFVTGNTPPNVALRIVNVSSGAALRAFPGLADYSASKAALRMAGMVLASELASNQRPGGIRQNAAILSYEPGVVDTPMQEASRSLPLEEFPYAKPFRELHERGLLERPEDAILPIVEFVSVEDCCEKEIFFEKRFGS